MHEQRRPFSSRKLTEAQEEVVEDLIHERLKGEPAREALALSRLFDSDKDYVLLYKLRNKPKAFDEHLRKVTGPIETEKAIAVTSGSLSTDEEVRQALETYKNRFMVPLPREKRLKEKIKDLVPLYSSETLVALCLDAGDAAAQAYTLATLQAFGAVVTFDIPAFITNAAAAQGALVAADNALYAAKAASGLTLGMLGYHVYCHVRDYWQGKTDWQTCIKECVSKTAFCSGAAFGAALFWTVGPAAGIIGSALSGDDKYRRLQIAYDTLGVSPSSTDDAIKKAYHKLAMKHHPDKDGDERQFIKINLHYELIRVARQEAAAW